MTATATTVVHVTGKHCVGGDDADDCTVMTTAATRVVRQRLRRPSGPTASPGGAVLVQPVTHLGQLPEEGSGV